MRAALVIVIIVLAAAPARADDREEARREFAAGQDADKRGDWQTAIEHYLRANDVRAHPFAMFNIANDYERLGQLREAATWYQRYLDAAKESPDRGKVEKTLADLKLRPAKLTIKTTPPGAKLSLDGARIGVTPFTGVARGGMHRVAVDLGGQHDERDVALEFGEPAELELVLGSATADRPTGGTYLFVTGTPGALVTVDGVAAGTVPANVAVDPGTHAVHVEAAGFVPFDTKAVVGSGQTVRLGAILPRALGTVDPVPKIIVGYVLGVGAGAQIASNDAGALFDASFGLRASQYEGLVRVGRANGATSFDLVLRWALTDARLAPFVGVGYAYVANGFGYELNGGLRYDVSRSDKAVVSVLAEGGLLYSSTTDDMTGMTSAGAVYPIQLAVELAYR